MSARALRARRRNIVRQNQEFYDSLEIEVGSFKKLKFKLVEEKKEKSDEDDWGIKKFVFVLEKVKDEFSSKRELTDQALGTLVIMLSLGCNQSCRSDRV